MAVVGMEILLLFVCVLIYLSIDKTEEHEDETTLNYFEIKQ